MRTLSSFVAVFGLICISTAVADGITIAERGRANAVIVVAADASAPQRHAADELVAFLKQVSGADIPIVNQPDAKKANLLVGAQAARLVDRNFNVDGLGTDGVVVKSI